MQDELEVEQQQRAVKEKELQEHMKTLSESLLNARSAIKEQKTKNEMLSEEMRAKQVQFKSEIEKVSKELMTKTAAVTDQYDSVLKTLKNERDGLIQQNQANASKVMELNQVSISDEHKIYFYQTL